MKWEEITEHERELWTLNGNMPSEWNNNDDFRVIIAGSRNFDDYNYLKYMCNLVLYYPKYEENKNIIVVSGTCRGADLLGEIYANENNYKIERYPAKWSLGKKAGYIRNTYMANVAQGAIIFMVGESKGSKNMYEIATKKNLLVRLIKYK